MSKRDGSNKRSPSEFDRARDELFRQIRHCGVLEASEDQREKWFKDTMDYMSKRYPGVSDEELLELGALGRRYCEPVRGYGGGVPR